MRLAWAATALAPEPARRISCGGSPSGVKKQFQLGNRTDTCIADEHVEPAISIACQRGERGHILAFRHVRAVVDRVAAGTFNLAHQSFQLISSSRSEHDFCAAM